MAYSFKTKENIGSKTTEYSRYYSGFRGVDFSSDHTQIHQSRLAYLVNMYKDYQSGQGEALETVAGFRRRTRFSNDEVYGIYNFKCKVDGKEVERVLVHSGKGLYLWRNYPYSMNLPKVKPITVGTASETTIVGETEIRKFVLELDFPCAVMITLKTQEGNALTDNATYDYATQTLTITSSTVVKDDVLDLEYYEAVTTNSDILYANMNERKSVSFVFNNRLYILDGKNYLVYDGNSVSKVVDNAYVPTTYISIIPAGENADNGKEYEQRNILTPKFKHTFIADGTTKEFYLNENNLDSVDSVKVYGVELSKDSYTVDLVEGKITLTEGTEAPKKPADMQYESGYAGIEITASKTYTSIDGVTENMDDYSELITNCTLCTTFDGRVFCTGNPEYPNYVFYCGRNSTGYADPAYFGVLNYVQDGVGLAPITGIMGVSNTLMVLKADTQQDSSVYFHSGTDTGKNILPRAYPSSQGLSGLGCVGACCNFLDDPVFISRLGVIGVSQLKIASERANEHRSSLIDAKLVNTDLSKACMEEWGGYLCVLTDGKMFLADSRQRYTDVTGAVQYEWYYLEDIGVWDGQYQEYKYSSEIAEEFKGVKLTHDGKVLDLELASAVFYPDIYETKDLRGTTANPPDDAGKETNTIYKQIVKVDLGGIEIAWQIAYVVYNDGDKTHAYLCESRGNKIGGVFKKATMLYSMHDNLYFGCENGAVCSFNFDERDEFGEIPATSYHFDERTIHCGCATLMDNCQIPHLTKSTIKRSTVIKTKSFKVSAAKVKVRTNKKPYEQIARINSSLFSFDDIDFTDFSFVTTDQSLFAIKEKEKQWVEKQYYIYSDEYMRPFSLYYISFRYRVAGRIKN